MLILHIWQCKENLIRPVLNIQIASPMVSVQTFGEVRTSRLQKSLLVRFPSLAEFIYVLLLHSQTLRKTSVTDHGRQEKGNHFWRAFSSVGVQRALKIEMRWPFRNPRNMNVKWSAEL